MTDRTKAHEVHGPGFTCWCGYRDGNVRARREVVYRAILAPNSLYTNWTVEDFRRFVRDCDAQGISGDTHVKREVNADYSFGTEYGLFVAERKVDLDPYVSVTETR